MKKVIVLVLLTGSLFALESMSSVFLGMSSVEFDIENDADNGVYFGADGFMYTQIEGLAVGVGGDYTGFNLPKYRYTNNSDDYTLAMQLKLGYSFEGLISWPVQLKTSLGYGVSRMYAENSWGYQYDVSLESKVYKSFGVGVKYKYVDTGSDIALLEDYTAVIGYARITF